MKERGILFSAPMVRALLAGQKTQTRRLIKPQPTAYPLGWRCPYSVETLWVRETIRRVGDRGVFAADGAASVIDTWPWQRNVLPAIHCPRGASRINLFHTSVRAEQLHDISEADAIAEGISALCGHRCRRGCGCASCVEDGCGSARDEFALLWDEINGDRAPWSSNPWVWVVSFDVEVRA